jgi:REP element-mobilizing transposase RayT
MNAGNPASAMHCLAVMARQLRIQFAGAIYHVMSRGNAKQDIFLDDQDRRYFLEELWRVAKRRDWMIWAYCLMANHYHLLLETRSPSLSVGMRDLNGGHALQFNRRHQRVGHLFQGRFRALLVDRDAYLLELVRYILLNPVRAGLCASLVDWRWHSYPDVIGLRTGASARLAVRPLLDFFAPTPAAARQRFARFVAAGVGLGPPAAHPKNTLLVGGDDFVIDQAARIDEASPEIPRAERTTRPISDFFAHAPTRDAGARDAYESGLYSQVEIARFLGLHYTTVCRMLARQRRRAGGPDRHAKIQDVTPP